MGAVTGGFSSPSSEGDRGIPVDRGYRAEKWVALVYAAAAIRSKIAAASSPSVSWFRILIVLRDPQRLLLLILIVFNVIVFIVGIAMCLLPCLCGHQSSCGAAY